MLTQTSIETNERWNILALAALTNALGVAVPSMCLSVLFKEISIDLNLNLVQVGLIWGIGSLPGILAALFGGPLSDHFGSKKVLVAATLLSGLTGALRGLSTNFVSLLVTVMLFSLFSFLIPLNITKTCRIWFSHRQLGMAIGVTGVGMAFGFLTGSMISATYLSPWLGSWRNVLFFYGALSIMLSVPWFFSRPVPVGSAADHLPGEGISMGSKMLYVARVRNIWLLGLALLGIGGAVQGVLGYLPLYLRDLGWQAAIADGALASFHLVSMIFVVPIALWSDRLRSRKQVLLFSALMFILGFGLLSSASGALIWVAVATSGLVRDGFMAVLFTMVNETEGIGLAQVGTATGFVLVLSNLGILLAPPLGNSLAAQGAGLPFIFWAGLTLAGSVGLALAQERK